MTDGELRAFIESLPGVSREQKGFTYLVWKGNDYSPSPAQQVIHLASERLILVAGGVGAGKSFSLAMSLVPWCAVPDSIVWLIGLNYDLARPEFFYLRDMFLKLGMIQPASMANPNKGPCSFRLTNNTTIATKSADDPIAIASVRPHAIGLCEAATMPGEMYLKAIERGTENNAKIIFSGTFEARLGWYADLFERWKGSNIEGGRSFSLPTWSNIAVYPLGYDDPRIQEAKANMGEARFNERYAGIPMQPEGLVFPRYKREDFVEDRSALFVPGTPVELWVDPAKHCYAVMFVQLVPYYRPDNEYVKWDGQATGDIVMGVHVLDEVYSRGLIAQQVIPKVIARPYWGYVKSGIIDQAGATQPGTKSQIEVWNDELRRLLQPVIKWKYRKVIEQDWRDAISLRLESVLFRFASHMDDSIDDISGKANGLLGELRSYRWAQRGENVSDPSRPIKKNEDALSALGYGCYIHFGPVLKRGNEGDGERKGRGKGVFTRNRSHGRNMELRNRIRGN